MVNYLPKLQIELERGNFLLNKVNNNNKNRNQKGILLILLYFVIIKKEVARMMFEICSAVKHLHDMGIAHRDLKPENLILTSNDENASIKLIDFGFAKQENLGLKTPWYYYFLASVVFKINLLISNF